MRIEQGAEFIKGLVQQAITGQLAPAAFQRPYVWGRDEVIALLESILKGYPVGSFLVWTPYTKADLSEVGRPRLGPVRLQAGAKPSSLLLDGQNRLASMAWAARDPAEPFPEDATDHERSVWNPADQLVINLATKGFEFVTNDEASEGFRLPLRAVFSGVIANPLIRERWDGPWAAYGEPTIIEALKWFDEAQGAFSRARTVVTNLEDATAEEALDAFLHICKTGVPMSEDDFKASISWAIPS